MFINEKKASIELTTAEMKEARKFGTKEYRDLQEARRDYPNFAVVEKKSKNKSDFANLNLKTIKDYVAKHGDDEQKEALSFMTKKRVDAESGEYSEPVSFFEIKNWFLNEFPELKKQRAEYRQKVQSILDAAANKAAA